MHIIDADKLLEVINIGIKHSELCSQVLPINNAGEYNVVSDIMRHLDAYTAQQLVVIRDYVMKNMV